MGRSVFGWSLPPGCTNRHIEEAMGGNAELEAFHDEVFELPELASLTDEQKNRVAEHFGALISNARAQGYAEANADNALARDVREAGDGDV
jgi:hypothetical protein